MEILEEMMREIEGRESLNGLVGNVRWKKAEEKYKRSQGVAKIENRYQKINWKVQREKYVTKIKNIESGFEGSSVKDRMRKQKEV